MSLLKELEGKKIMGFGKSKQQPRKLMTHQQGRDPYAELKSNLHKKIVDELKDVTARDRDNTDVLIKRIEKIVEELITETGQHILRWDKVRITNTSCWCTDIISLKPATSWHSVKHFSPCSFASPPFGGFALDS